MQFPNDYNKDEATENRKLLDLSSGSSVNLDDKDIN